LRMTVFQSRCDARGYVHKGHLVASAGCKRDLAPFLANIPKRPPSFAPSHSELRGTQPFQLFLMLDECGSDNGKSLPFENLKESPIFPYGELVKGTTI